jgi:ribosomal protein S18 acetylase RimI-like enzyme
MEVQKPGQHQSEQVRKQPLAQLKIDQLDAGEYERFKAVRLRSLQDAPSAFSTKLEDARAWATIVWREQLQKMTTFVAVRTEGGSSDDVGLVRCVLHSEALTASLVSLWVAPEARRAGLASALICAVVTRARNEGMGRLVLEVIETNAPAIALYRKHGFVPSGERMALDESGSGTFERQFELLL